MLRTAQSNPAPGGVTAQNGLDTMQQQAQPQLNHATLTMSLSNDLGVDLSLKGTDIDAGKITTGPVKDIGSGESASPLFVAENKDGSAVGPKGVITYDVDDGAGTTLTIGYSIPAIGKDSVVITFLDGNGNPTDGYTYTLNPSDPKGFNPTMQLTVNKS